MDREKQLTGQFDSAMHVLGVRKDPRRAKQERLKQHRVKRKKRNRAARKQRKKNRRRK